MYLIKKGNTSGAAYLGVIPCCDGFFIPATNCLSASTAKSANPKSQIRKLNSMLVVFLISMSTFPNKLFVNARSRYENLDNYPV